MLGHSFIREECSDEHDRRSFSRSVEQRWLVTCFSGGLLGMLCIYYWVYIILNYHNRKIMTFASLMHNLAGCLNMYLSVISGIKRKPLLSMAWNWHHLVTNAMLHQPRSMESADIIMSLQLSDISSIPPIHGVLYLIPILLLYLITHKWPDLITRLGTPPWKLVMDE